MNYVDGTLNRAVRRTRNTGGAMNCREMSDWLEDAIAVTAERWSPFYGPLTDAWVGVASPKRPPKRFGLVANTILGGLLRSVDSTFMVDVDHDGQGEPIALVLSRSNCPMAFVEIEMTPRRLRIGDTWFTMASPDAGRRIIRCISGHAGGFFGRSTTVVH